MQAIHVATDEIGDIEETFRIAPVAYLQHKPGPLGATINSVSTPRAEVREVSFGTDATIVSGVLPCFVLGVGTQGNPLLCGNVLRESQVAYVGGNNGGTAYFGGNAGWCNACVDAGLLQEVASIHRYSVPVGDGAQAIPRSTVAALASWLLQLARGGSGTELDDAQFDDEVALAAHTIKVRRFIAVGPFVAKRTGRDRRHTPACSALVSLHPWASSERVLVSVDCVPHRL